VVNFVKKSDSGTFIVRPKPSKALSPHTEKSGEHKNDGDARQPELATFIVRPKPPTALRPPEESDVEESDDEESGAEASER
jgi:hypothetical protein